MEEKPKPKGFNPRPNGKINQVIVGEYSKEEESDDESLKNEDRGIADLENQQC